MGEKYYNETINYLFSQRNVNLCSYRPISIKVASEKNNA